MTRFTVDPLFRIPLENFLTRQELKNVELTTETIPRYMSWIIAAHHEPLVVTNNSLAHRHLFESMKGLPPLANGERPAFVVHVIPAMSESPQTDPKITIRAVPITTNQFLVFVGRLADEFNSLLAVDSWATKDPAGALFSMSRRLRLCVLSGVTWPCSSVPMSIATTSLALASAIAPYSYLDSVRQDDGGGVPISAAASWLAARLYALSMCTRKGLAVNFHDGLVEVFRNAVFHLETDLTRDRADHNTTNFVVKAASKMLTAVIDRAAATRQVFIQGSTTGASDVHREQEKKAQMCIFGAGLAECLQCAIKAEKMFCVPRPREQNVVVKGVHIDLRDLHSSLSTTLRLASLELLDAYWQKSKEPTGIVAVGFPYRFATMSVVRKAVRSYYQQYVSSQKQTEYILVQCNDRHSGRPTVVLVCQSRMLPVNNSFALRVDTYLLDVDGKVPVLANDVFEMYPVSYAEWMDAVYETSTEPISKHGEFGLPRAKINTAVPERVMSPISPVCTKFDVEIPSPSYRQFTSVVIPATTAKTPAEWTPQIAPLGSRPSVPSRTAAASRDSWFSPSANSQHIPMDSLPNMIDDAIPF